MWGPPGSWCCLYLMSLIYLLCDDLLCDDDVFCLRFEVFTVVTMKASSGMLRHVALIRTDVSEELSASITRVTRIGELLVQ
jgi:hypothetical protein